MGNAQRGVSYPYPLFHFFSGPVIPASFCCCSGLYQISAIHVIQSLCRRAYADGDVGGRSCGRGGAAKVAYRNDAVRAARRYFGHFALATNQPMDTFEALRHYRLRERIEEFFGMDKRHFDGRRTRLWSADALRGRQFVQFVGLGYLGRFRRMLEEAAAGLGEPREGATGDRLKLEKNLKNWLASRSTQDLFDGYDCVETTQVRTKAGRYRWSTESVRRDALFLERLGIPPSE